VHDRLQPKADSCARVMRHQCIQIRLQHRSVDPAKRFSRGARQRARERLRRAGAG
jgi:hypothetical protein